MTSYDNQHHNRCLFCAAWGWEQLRLWLLVLLMCRFCVVVTGPKVKKAITLPDIKDVRQSCDMRYNLYISDDAQTGQATHENGPQTGNHIPENGLQTGKSGKPIPKHKLLQQQILDTISENVKRCKKLKDRLPVVDKMDFRTRRRGRPFVKETYMGAYEFVINQKFTDPNGAASGALRVQCEAMLEAVVAAFKYGFEEENEEEKGVVPHQAFLSLLQFPPRKTSKVGDLGAQWKEYTFTITLVRKQPK